jgi:8-oxo-dGTP diphosphatase
MIELCGCAIIEEGKLLLLFKKNKQHYEFPGGKIEAGEAPADTAKREAREELGVEVELVAHASDEVFMLDGIQYRSHKYLARITSGTPHVVETDKFDHLCWMPIESYAEFPVAPNVVMFCKKYLGKA